MDNIPNVALRTAVNAIPEMFLDMYNTFLAERTFRMYDILKIQLPPGAEMMAFEDNTGLIVSGMDLEEIRRILGDCYEEVQRWMKSVGLELADHKTEAVLFTITS